MSLTELEAGTGIRRQQIARWKDRHGLPVNEDGSYSLAAVIVWIRKNPRIGQTRKYTRKPGAVEKRIIARCATVVREELGHEPR